jgi:WS/DGAT/MGAT family acyltransferase
MSLERLRLDELAGAWVGDRCTPFQIGLLGVFDGTPFLLPDGALDVERIRGEVGLRASRVPELRRRVLWTHWGEGRPVWVEDPTFDPMRHVATPRPGAGDHLATWAANRAVVPLDRDRPLWRVDVVDGLPDGRFGLLVVVDHVLADGLAGLRIAAALLDTEPDGVVVDVVAPVAPALPTRRQLVLDRLARWRRTPRGPRRTPGALARGCAGLAAVRSVYRDVSGPPPATSLPSRVGAGRRMVEVSAPLDRARDAGHLLGVTVNDLILAAVAEGLRDLLAARGELEPGTRLRTTVPVATGQGQTSGMIVVDLPVGVADPAERLGRIHSSTVTRKARLVASGGGASGVLRLPDALARPVVQWGRRWGSRSVTLAVSNVPGPTTPLWLAGARMERAVPIAPLVPSVPLSVAALSYAGNLVVSVNADAAIGDLEIMASGISGAFGRYSGT